MLLFVPDHFKTQDVCNEVVRREPYNLRYAPDHLKTQEICDETVHTEPLSLAYVPDGFKTQKMCDQAVRDDSSSLQFVPDWFVTQEQIDLWDDDDKGFEWYDDGKDKFFDEGYKKRKAQKAKIKEELLPITWHPSRYWDWCMSEDEKKETEKLWV